MAELSVAAEEATNIEARSATLNGELEGMGEAEEVEVYFQYSTSSDYSENTEETERELMTDTGSFSEHLTGLSPDTTYYFRAVAEGL